MLAVLKQFRIVISHVKHHYRDVEAATGISGAQLWALFAIERAPGGTVGGLAKELGIHQSTASNLLDRLTALGFVERKRAEADQRIVTVQLTRAGKRAVAKAPKPAIGVLQQALLTLPQKNISMLQARLDEVIKAIGVKRAAGAGTLLAHSLGSKPAKN